MKKFFGKIKDLMLNHKLLSIIVLLAFILFLILIFMVLTMTISTTNKYGNRLDGIKEVQISKKSLRDVEKELEKNEKIEDASVHIKGKIIYFDITFIAGTSKDNAKEIATETVSNFSEEELSFYDLEYVLIEKDDDKEDTTPFVITGTKHASKDKISWIKS